MKRIYLAGPDIFHPEADAIGEAKKALVRAAGAEPLWPGDEPHELDHEDHPPPLVALAIFQHNIRLIRSADAVLANLTPFRGPSADVGAAVEVGFAFGLNKPVFGYSNVAAPFADRTRATLGQAGDGLAIEDFALPSDNLMVHYSLADFVARDAADRWHDLASFEAALAAAARRL